MSSQPDRPLDLNHTPWVRRPWCLWLAVSLVLVGALLNTLYLFNHSPIDLTEDESHYWEWSRHLDYGYYSKPPGIAWVLWATLRIGATLGLNGDGSGAALMPVMRMAAVLFGIVSGMLSLFLARRIFRDDRAALSVIILSAAVPMFAVGSLLITIDSPMYMCWAATVFCLWRAVESRTTSAPSIRWLYAAGLCAALGMMFKPVLIALPICVAIAAWADRAGMRKTFKTWHAAGALLVMMCSQIPFLIWNAHHDWVTFRHILTQGGMGQQAGATPSHKSPLQSLLLDPLARLAEYIGGQAGGMGGIMFVLLVIAAVVAWRHARTRNPVATATTPPPHTPASRTRWIFLLSFTLPLWAFYLLMNLWKRTELNWPAASYFTGMILLAGVFTEGWHALDLKNRHAWRTWGRIAIVWGILMTSLALNAHRFYPLSAQHLQSLTGTPAYFSSWYHPKFWEAPIADKLRGMQARADALEPLRAQLAQETGQEPLIITGRYDTSSSLAFYLPNHPFVFCIMSSVGGRQSQYDLWPGLNQKTTDGTLALAGRPALIIGLDKTSLQTVVAPAFNRLVGPEKVPVTWHGITLKEVLVYRAYGFKGMAEHPSGTY